MHYLDKLNPMQKQAVLQTGVVIFEGEVQNVALLGRKIPQLAACCYGVG